MIDLNDPDLLSASDDLSAFSSASLVERVNDEVRNDCREMVAYHLLWAVRLLDDRKRTIKYHLTRERVKRWRRRQRYDLWVLGTHRARLLGLARAEAARLTSEERTNLDEIFPGLI